MCFGDMETQKQSTNTLSPELQNASTTDVNLAQNFATKPVTPYTGQTNVPQSADTNSSNALLRAIAGSGNPYLSDIENLYQNFSSSPAQRVSAPSLLGPGTNVNSASLTDYMNPYVQAALQPTLDSITRQGTANQKALNAQATMDGAFGDARSGIEAGENTRNTNQLLANTEAQGYSNAFDKAAGLRSTDVNNAISTGTTNANLMEQALQRAITGGQALQGLDTSQVNRGLSSAGALENAGNVQDKANYAEFLRQQGFPEQQIATLTSAIQGNAPYNSTQTTSAPNNSGYGIAGSLGGTALSTLLPLIISDRTVKTDIVQIGQMYDGTPIYRFRYLGQEKVHIGLMAQDLEEVCPEAVVTIEGVKMVNYDVATRRAAEMGA